MYSRVGFSNIIGVLAVTCIAGLAAPRAWAQSPPPAATHEPAPGQHEHAMTGMTHDHADHEMQLEREGSGTAWLPDETPMYAIHWQRGAWLLMAHENAFVQFLHETGERGDDQFGSINWFMGMAHRDLGPGRLMLRGMFSTEPWTIRGCGYPDLLASGEQCNGEKIHDRQHPHDFMMEISGEYDAPLTGPVRWQVYGGPAGEPALGPVGYPHRVSALPNPLAPISHHWLDSTHITYGLITGGVYGARWKAEGSVFNGREPDEHRADFDFGPLDSISGRLSFLPTARLSLQVSAGRLTEAEAGEHGGPRADVSRVTASATYHANARDNGIWATTLAWGRNEEAGHGSNALLIETNLTLHDRDSWFGRFETVEKTAHDLALEESSEAFTLAKLQGGYTRYLPARKRMQLGLGAAVSAGFVPQRLERAYGSRINAGFGVFVTVRPAAMMMMDMVHGGAPMDHSQHTAPSQMDHSHHMAPQGSQPSATPPGNRTTPTKESAANEPRLPVTEAERVIDPACAATINLAAAPKATYQRKVYYFCSAADRDEFLKDPAVYLKKRGK